MRRFFLAVFCVLACFRCAPAADTFTMGISNKHISSGYLYLGQAHGFFAEEGIDLRLVFIPVSVAPTALVALQLDGMEFASTGIELGMHGGPIKTVFFQSDKPGWFLMSNPSISDLRQLSGKAVSVGTLGSGAHTFTMEILKKNGVDPRSVVFIAGRGGSDIRLQMLVNGTVQAANLLPPYTFVAEKQGFRQLMFYGDYAPLAQFGLVVNESLLKNKRPLLKRVIRAFLKSHLYMLQHRSEAVAWFVKNLRIEAGDAERTFEVLQSISTRNGAAPEPALQNALGNTAKSQNFKTAAVVDYSLLREVQDELGLK